MMNDDHRWHVDRRVPLALIFTLIGQTLAFVWWAAAASTRLDVLERRVEASAPQHERIIRLEEKIGVVQQGIAEIKAILRPDRTGPR